MTHQRLRVVELYAGTARSADVFRAWKCCQMALLVDSDPFAAKVYLDNHPGAPYLVESLSRLTPAEVRSAAGGRVDILLGCPPCQGFSDTGSRDPDDWRNRHLTRFRLFVEALRPLAVAMENVPLAAGGRRFRKFVAALERMGYRATWGILNAALRGSSQCRHRLLYVAVRGDAATDPVIPPPSHGGHRRYFNYANGGLAPLENERIAMLAEAPAVRRMRRDMPYQDTSLGKRPIPTVEQVICDLPSIGSARAQALAHYAWQHTAAMRCRMAGVPEGGRWSGGEDHFSHSYGRLHRRGLARTVTTFFSNPGSGRFWHPTEDRCLSVREAARLQGFPDSFRFPSDDAMRTCGLVGNALDGALAETSYRVIRDALE